MASFDVNTLWVMLCALLVFIMQVGFLALEAGMTRQKNNIDVAIKNIADFTISSVMFWMIGFPIMFGYSFLGFFSPFFDPNSSHELTTIFLFQVMFCGTTVTILSGAIAERTRFNMYIVVSVIISALIYPVFGQWVWAINADGVSVGWLAQLGFHDFAGSTVVHSIGGWAALAMIMIVGPRTGRFNEDGTANQIPASNLPFAVLGVLLLWFGWHGFNGGSMLAFNETTLLVIFNTLLSGSLGGVSGYIFGFILNRKGDINLILNGVLAALVSVTAGANAFGNLGVLGAAIGGTTVYIGLSYLLVKLRLDDVVDAIPVHLGGGIWGTIAVGLFGNLQLLGTDLSRMELIAVQLFGVGVASLWAFSSVWLIMKTINHFSPLRVSEESEYIGLNISEHGARTDLVNLLDVMQTQAQTRDLSIRAHVEPYTELGRIANYYNQVIESLEETQQTLALANDDLNTQLEKVQRINKKLSVANEQIKNFANILSHDLRTPITSIRALVGEVQNDLADIQTYIDTQADAPTQLKMSATDFMPEALRLIDAAINKMEQLTQQILVVAREESRTYNPQPIHMQHLMQSLVDMQAGNIRQNNIQVTINTLPDTIADEIMLTQVFSNLISNAIKYLDPSRTGEIIIDGKQTPTSVIYTIQDNGLGIPEAQFDRVFQLFRRVGKHRNIEGNGFGLFYIRNLLQRVDGDIWFESTEGIGTTFYVELPSTPPNQDKNIEGHRCQNYRQV